MNRKKIISLIVIVLLLSIIGGGAYYFLTKQDKNTTLTILEKQWIEENKNNIIDLGIVNGVPVFNYDGEGLLFDFISDIEKDTNLEFNKISYTINGEVPSEYAFMYVDEYSDDDILIYQDNYVLLTKEQKKYNRLKDIPSMVIGVLENDLESINYVLKANSNLSYKTYSKEEELFNAIEDKNSPIQAIALPKTITMDKMGTENYHIAYQITEKNKYLVLHLGETKKLNTIIKKYYKKWNRENYQSAFYQYFSNSYFTFNDVYEEEIANFRSKRYQYAFISNAPYDDLIDGRLVGINNEIMKQFSKVADIEISYKQYPSIEKLLADFNANKVDFFMNTSTTEKYEMDVYDATSVYEEEAVIVSHNNQNITVQSLASLKGKVVSVIQNSQIEKMLKNYGIETKGYRNIKDLINETNKNSILAIEKSAYELYSHQKLKKYKVDYDFDVEGEYHYTVRDIQDNNVFANYLSFYLSFINEKQYHNLVHYDMFEEKVKNTLEVVIVIFSGLAVLGFGIFLLWRKSHKKTKKKSNSMSKESKLKYIDMLTSLKNRNFLNDSIPKWDDSDIYPQALIIVDLNNVAYINDNYGHEEGDNLIREAANILIKNQAPNSEIMRTNGNEFLIYMVEYEEKQVVAYIRKLSKEFKELAHGFGAAIGYSMINDPIKTVDDAINEATLDMRNNKEEANN